MLSAGLGQRAAKDSKLRGNEMETRIKEVTIQTNNWYGDWETHYYPQFKESLFCFSWWVNISNGCGWFLSKEEAELSIDNFLKSLLIGVKYRKYPE